MNFIPDENEMAIDRNLSDANTAHLSYMQHATQDVRRNSLCRPLNRGSRHSSGRVTPRGRRAVSSSLPSATVQDDRNDGDGTASADSRRLTQRRQTRANVGTNNETTARRKEAITQPIHLQPCLNQRNAGLDLSPAVDV